MITGFNTDIEHGGVVYHIQTEDKGLASPLILSLVYTGGTILASKRSPYDDLIASGFNERTLAERLQRQHKLICAAVHAGRIEDLKRLTVRTTTASPSAKEGERSPIVAAPISHKTIAPNQQSSPATTSSSPPPLATTAQQPPTVATEPPLSAPSAPGKPATAASPVVRAQQPGKADFARVAATSGTLHLSLLEEPELRAGDNVILRVRLSRGPAGQRTAVVNASITLKILGTSFQPLVNSATTDHDGIAIIFAALPRFSTGRAAILLRAAANDYEAELRRIIHPA